MLLHATQATSGLKARFCVVGSGMGGAAVAQALARAGQDVLVLEAGGADAVPESNSPVQAEHVGRPFNIPVSRCIELGGTSNQWHGICGMLDDIDFERRPWVSAPGWPFTRADLAPFYTDAAALLQVRATAAGDAHAVEPALRQKFADIGFDGGILANKLVRYRKPPFRWKETLLDLARRNAIRIVLGARALRLVLSDDGRIERLVAGGADATFDVRADVFIVCAGGLETPRLLLNSRTQNGDSPGNSTGLVGRYLLDHPVGHFCKLRFAKTTAAPLYASLPTGGHTGAITGLMLTAQVQRERALPNHHLWIRPSVSVKRLDDDLLMSFLAARGARDLTARQVWAILSNPDIRYRILVHRFGIRPRYKYGDLFFMTEQLPNARSRVTLSKRADADGYPIAQVDWQLSHEDLERFQAYARVLFDEGLRSDHYHLARTDEPAIWDRSLASAAHHLGTARMAATAADGVVDANLRVFGTTNLFVCDGSVFPTAGGVNPSLTITALALRLASHLLA